MNASRNTARYSLCLFIAIFSLSKAHSDFSTTVPISVEVANNIVNNVFPVALKVNQTNLYLTQPKVHFSSNKRIAILAQLQAYDHRPEQGIAISEMGAAHISGELDFDSSSGEVLLRNSRIEALSFNRDNAASQRFLLELTAAWNAQVTSLIRTELPPHPYLLVFKNNIKNIAYDGSHINLVIGSSNGP